MKKKALVYALQGTPDLDKALTLSSIVLSSLSHEENPLDHGPSKPVNNPTYVTLELPTQAEKIIHAHQNHLIPPYRKEPLFSSHIGSINDQNPATTLDSDFFQT